MYILVCFMIKTDSCQTVISNELMQQKAYLVETNRVNIICVAWEHITQKIY